MPADPDGSSEYQSLPPETVESSAPLAALGRWVRQTLSRQPEHSLKEALQEVLNEHDESGEPIDSEELTLLRNMVAFGELKVSDVMIPRTDIVSISDQASFDDFKELIARDRHTRIPLYQETLDHITGFVHIKDFVLETLGDGKRCDLNSLKREVLFVPASMKVIDLLLKMRLASCHMAIVVDEYGGTDGLLTMEDLIEEIVGEIYDEHDDEEDSPELRWINDRALEADARVEIDDLMEELELEALNGDDLDDIDTVGGLIFSHLGRIPAKGEVIEYGTRLKFEILSADPRRIRKVKIVKQTAPVAEHV